MTTADATKKFLQPGWSIGFPSPPVLQSWLVCVKANVKMTRLLVMYSADVFAHFSVDGWTALHSACHGGHDHMAKLLVEEARLPLHVATNRQGFN